MMVDIYLVGVGGQGIITASRIIGTAAMNDGKGVLLSETHGMAQRGGGVVCTARIGDVNSPLIPDREADVVLSLEILETLRAICKVSSRTTVISSTERIVPLTVSTQKLKYPSLEEIDDRLNAVARRLVTIDSVKLAREAGTPISSNVVMVGALAGSGLTGIARKRFEKAVEVNIQRNFEENLRAFAAGFDEGGKAAV